MDKENILGTLCFMNSNLAIMRRKLIKTPVSSLDHLKLECVRSGDVKLQGEPRIRRPRELDNNVLKASMGNEPLLVAKEIGDELSVNSCR